MWKLALIAWLFFAILRWLFGAVTHSLSSMEKAAFAIRNDIPKRLIVVSVILIAEFIISVILTIIAIIRL